MAERLTLWFLRQFRAFRALEQRALLLSEAARHGREKLSRTSTARVEAEVLHTLLLQTSCLVEVDVLPTQQVSWLGPGQIMARLFEGGGKK